MVVQKQTYTLTAGFTKAQLADALGSALVHAGLMTEWFDSFAISGREFRVMRIVHDSTKKYGASFYCFAIFDASIGVFLTTGWKASGTAPINVPIGTQYLDYHLLPSQIQDFGYNQNATHLFTFSTTSNLFIERYTSQLDTAQSFFIFRQPFTVTQSVPFAFLHPSINLYSWIDLGRSAISGLLFVELGVLSRTAVASFTIQENLRRCAGIGIVLRDYTAASAAQAFHGVRMCIHSFIGLGCAANSPSTNLINIGNSGGQRGAHFPLMTGRVNVNPEYEGDYYPISTEFQWSFYSPRPIALDFGIFMAYTTNQVAVLDRFIVTPGTNEWEVLGFVNNSVLTDNAGASGSFVARVV